MMSFAWHAPMLTLASFEADFEIVAWVGPDRVAVGKGCGVGGGAQKEDGEKGREHVGKLECVVRLC